MDIDAGLGIEPGTVVTTAVFELAHPVASVGLIRGIEEVVRLCHEGYFGYEARPLHCETAVAVRPLSLLDRQCVMQREVGDSVGFEDRFFRHRVVEILLANRNNRR